jgi:two-component system, OmpR family, sensor histidine kinase CiaH
MALQLAKQRNIKEATYLYWLLLAYIIAALVWWFISLEKQNKERTSFEMQALRVSQLQKNESALFTTTANNLLKAQKRRTAKHISEGLTFLGVLLIGAILVYRAVHKQFRLNKQQQNFIMAVTHELKTPIAISKLNVETLLKRKLSDEQQAKLLQNTLMEMHRLNDLATNILVVSQIESGAYAMNKEMLSVSELMTDLLKDLQNQYIERTIQSSLIADKYIKGDRLLLKLAITTLIDNALKYAPKQEPVMVTLTESEITVKDYGVGIDKMDKHRIFEKFYRVGNEATRTTKGTGLGLYLCKKILSDHQLTISVTDNTPKGSIFTIRF